MFDPPEMRCPYEDITVYCLEMYPVLFLKNKPSIVNVKKSKRLWRLRKKLSGIWNYPPFVRKAAPEHDASTQQPSLDALFNGFFILHLLEFIISAMCSTWRQVQTPANNTSAVTDGAFSFPCKVSSCNDCSPFIHFLNCRRTTKIYFMRNLYLHPQFSFNSDSQLSHHIQ